MSLTKTQLATFMDKHSVPHASSSSLKGIDGAIRLRTCQAWYKDFGSYIILRSYDTNVAIFIKRTGTLLVRDRYSATTTCHVNHFLNEMEDKYRVMRVTYLYKRSDRIIELGWGNRANTYKLTKAEFEKVKANDFAGYIPTLTVTI